jgi:hypothetical protein
MATARSTALATREIVVFVASALVLVASFLSISGDYGITPWHQATLWLLVLGYLTAVAVGVIVALDRFTGTPSPARAVGLSEGQLLGVLSTVSLATFVLTLLSGGSAGGGLLLAFIGSVILFIVTVFGSRIPALAAR